MYSTKNDIFLYQVFISQAFAHKVIVTLDLSFYNLLNYRDIGFQRLHLYFIYNWWEKTHNEPVALCAMWDMYLDIAMDPSVESL